MRKVPHTHTCMTGNRLAVLASFQVKVINCYVSLFLQLVAQGQFRVLKVPLGFIKVLEWVSSLNQHLLHSYSHKTLSQIFCNVPIILEKNVMKILLNPLAAWGGSQNIQCDLCSLAWTLWECSQRFSLCTQTLKQIQTKILKPEDQITCPHSIRYRAGPREDGHTVITHWTDGHSQTVPAWHGACLCFCVCPL